MQLRKKDWYLKGMRDGIPIALGYFAVAITLGISARNAGLTALQATLASFTNNASAGEFIGFTLIAANASYVEVFLMEAVANARYLLMSTALSQKLKPDAKLWERLVIGYDVTDVHYWNSFWQEEQRFDLFGQRSHALWGEAGVGIKVKLWNSLSMGWMIRYHNLFNYGKNDNSKPWFIPGYGPRNSSLGLSLGLYYTLPLHRRSAPSSTTPSQP